MNKTRIAVAGAGSIGQAHAEVIRQSAEATLAALVDPAASAAQVAEQAQVPLFSSLEALFAHQRPDAIVLATPNPLHMSHARACMAAGVPILLEKPVAPTVHEAQALADEVERAGARVLVGHHRAHSPIMARARQMIDAGRLGPLVAVMGSAVFYKPDLYFADAPWRREIGGGPILLNMIHEVHNLRMLCGEIVAVQAMASQAMRGHPVEDTVAINLRFANGALGSFMLSDTAACPRSWEQTAQENQAYASYPDEDCYVIAGTHGSLSVPTMRLRTYPRDEDRSWWKPFETRTVFMQREDPLARQMAHFIDVARGEAAPIVSVRDGLQNLRVTEAIAEAARTGALVPVAAD